MTEEKRCEPPPEELTPEEWLEETAAALRKAGWDATVETAPVTPPAVVAALVEALEEIADLCRLPIATPEQITAKSAGEIARAALAAYREAGR